MLGITPVCFHHASFPPYIELNDQMGLFVRPRKFSPNPLSSIMNGNGFVIDSMTLP